MCNCVHHRFGLVYLFVDLYMCVTWSTSHFCLYKECMSVCNMHVCMYNCMYVSMYVCLYVCIYVCIHAGIHVGVYVDVCMRACISVNMLDTQRISDHSPTKHLFSLRLQAPLFMSTHSRASINTLVTTTSRIRHFLYCVHV